ncbi:MAG TPA: hypothetical protein VHZ56_07455 [Devosia sp.]|nr:hypothetical protein [Devosia sp.]
MNPPANPIIQLSPEQMEARRKRQRRNATALALVLGFLVVLFYVLTIVKMGPALFTTRDL